MILPVQIHNIGPPLESGNGASIFRWEEEKR